MKTLIFFISLFLISPVIVHAQVYTKDSFSTVIVHKDPRFDELAAMQAEINRRSYLSTSRFVRGFRIQAANTQNRDEANAIKAELLRRFPDQKSYLLYQAPNFRVRIGNFLTQKDASKLRKMISALYPGKGIYIVPDIVEHTPSADDVYEQDILDK
ncbi:MAG: SPOR domain-containing protein [uncultured Segetibacter sp.]|uniref:SPOR domain-containing protein n=1 Tax=uncultured Segetibacter sp. TaxID=481133 RepID=A0A6J4TAR4_9BACT|nr:MAG: SPOR domain-containing protein [uncultured Segetibacter sp.]